MRVVTRLTISSDTTKQAKMIISLYVMPLVPFGEGMTCSYMFGCLSLWVYTSTLWPSYKLVSDEG